MNKTLGLEMKLLSIGTLLGNMEGGSFTGEFGGRVKKKALEMGVSFCRVPLCKQGSPLNGNFMR